MNLYHFDRICSNPSRQPARWGKDNRYGNHPRRPVVKRAGMRLVELLVRECEQIPG